MMFWKKKAPQTPTEQKCAAPGCLFTCNDPVTLKKHTDWKYPKPAGTRSGKKAVHMVEYS